MRILVVNAGSSSVKFRLLDAADAVERSADLPAGADGFSTSRLAEALHGWPEPEVAGHRVVHGGTALTGAVRIDPAVRQQLQDLTALARCISPSPWPRSTRSARSCPASHGRLLRRHRPSKP